MIYHSAQIHWIEWIHLFRTPNLDGFFKFLNYFDGVEFVLILIPFVWLGKSWKSGLRFLLIFLISVTCNQLLKSVFGSPRPYHLAPHLGLLPIKGLGFPSGAAQTVILLTGIALSTWHTRLKYLLPFTYIPLISFSRIYLGAHFFTDILAGWMVGLMLWGVYIYAFPSIERYLEKFSAKVLCLGTTLASLLLYAIIPSKLTLFISADLTGIALALYIAHLFKLHLPPPKNALEFCLRGLLGAIGLFVCYYTYTTLFDTSLAVHKFFRLFATAAWMGIVNQLLCHYIMVKPFYATRHQ